MKAIYIIGTVMSALLMGCGTLSNRYDPRKTSEPQISEKLGVIILSAGAPEKCIVTGTFLKVLPDTATYNSKWLELLPVDGYAIKSDFSDHHGFLHAVSLPPGKYYLAPWIANNYVSAVSVPKAEFSVAAGEVVYLGEYYMPVSCVLNPRSVFRDQQERDLALLARMNPALAKAKIVPRIPTFSGYAVGGPK